MKALFDLAAHRDSTVTVNVTDIGSGFEVHLDCEYCSVELNLSRDAAKHIPSIEAFLSILCDRWTEMRKKTDRRVNKWPKD